MADKLIDDARAEGELLACAARVAETVDGQDTHAEVIGPIAQQYARNDEWDLAVQLADTITDPFQRDQVLADIAVICAATDRDYAVELVDSLEELGFQTLAKGNMAVAEADRGNLDEALEFAHQLDDPSGTIAEIAIRLANRARFDEAVDVAEGADFEGSRAWAFTEIAARRLEREEIPEAIELLDRALAETDSLELPEDRISLILDIVPLLLKTSDTTRVHELLDRCETEVPGVTSETVRDRLLARIVEGNAASGRFDRADSLTETIEDPLQAVAAMTAVSNHLDLADEKEKALTTLDEALRLTNETEVWEERSLNNKEALLTGIAFAYLDQGHTQKAVDVADSILTETSQSNCLYNLAVRLIAREEIDAAIETVNLIQNDHTRTICLVGLCSRLSESHPEQAAGALELAESTAPTLPMLFQRADAEAKIALRHTDKDVAHKWLTKALETTREISGVQQKALELLALSKSYAEAGIELNSAEKEILRDIVIHLK